MQKHSDLAVEKEKYNNFETEEDINNYCNNEDNYYLALNQSLSNNKMQELAMYTLLLKIQNRYILSYKKVLQDHSIIEKAVENKCLIFLEYILLY